MAQSAQASIPPSVYDPIPPSMVAGGAATPALPSNIALAQPNLVAPQLSSAVPVPPSLVPIYQRESHFNYNAQNPASTASGAGQDINSTWREATHALGYGDQWPTAKDAPPEVQNAANIWLQGRYGNKPWAASDPNNIASGLQKQAAQFGQELHQTTQEELSNINASMQHYAQVANQAPFGSKEQDEALARQEQLSEQSAATFDKLAAHPPTFTPMDAMQRLGSLATVIAVLGGLKSRQPLTASLNAAGEAMKALNQNNYDQYKISYDQWKTQSDLVVQSLRAHSEAINQILSNKRLSIEEKNSELNAFATITQNQLLKAKIAQGDILGQYKFASDISNLAIQQQHMNLEMAKLDEAITHQKVQEEHTNLQNKLLDFQISQLKGVSASTQNTAPGDANSALTKEGQLKKPDNVSDGVWEAAKIYVLAGKEPPSTWGGATRQAIMNEIPVVRAAMGLSEKEMVAGWSQVAGLTSAERALGTRSAALDVGLREAEHAADPVFAASKKVPRYNLIPLNKLLLAAETGTGNKEVVQFGIAVRSFLNAYAKAINPTGRLTDSQQNHAIEMLSTAMSEGQIQAGVHQLLVEIENYRKGISDSQKDVPGIFGMGKEPTFNSPSTYTSPDDVYKAFDAGKLTKDQAKDVLIKQFGFNPQ